MSKTNDQLNTARALTPGQLAVARGVLDPTHFLYERNELTRTYYAELFATIDDARAQLSTARDAAKKRVSDLNIDDRGFLQSAAKHLEAAMEADDTASADECITNIYEVLSPKPVTIHKMDLGTPTPPAGEGRQS